MTEEINKIGGLGASEIGALFTKNGLKDKTSHTLAFKKALELLTGQKETFTTYAMQCGIFNESDAFTNVVRPVFPTAKYQSDKSIPIKEGLWATPDVIDDDNGFVLDIKCPFSIYTFFQQCNKLPSSYIAQSQMQMMATKYSKGYVLLYLTSNDMDEFGNTIEYDISLNDRHKFIGLDADEDFQREILVRSGGLFSMRDTILSHLQKATEISDIEYFELGKSDHKITRFKDKSNLLAWEGKIYKNVREGYLVIE